MLYYFAFSFYIFPIHHTFQGEKKKENPSLSSLSSDLSAVII